jgi:hypothetical protein
MFQSGSQINAGLGRTDYSAYTQGAAQGAAAIGQGMQQLGQGIGAAIKDFSEQKKLNKQKESAIKASTKQLEGFGEIAASLPPKAQKAYMETLQQLNDPSVSVDDKFALSQGATKTLADLVGLGYQTQDRQIKQQMLESQAAEQNKQRHIESARNALILGKKNPVGVYSPEVLDAAEVGRMEFEGKMAAKETPEWKAFLGASPADRALMKEFKGAGSSNTTVNLPPGQKKYDEIAGEALYKRQDEMHKTGQRLTTEIKKNNEILALIESGKPVTGAVQPLRLWVKKAADAVFGGDKDALNSASSTEIMEALMTSMGISAASQAGVTSSMMNTEKEGERIRNAFGGTALTEPETIKFMAELRDSIYRAQMNDYNAWAASDSARMFERSQMVKVTPFNFPTRKTKGANANKTPIEVFKGEYFSPTSNPIVFIPDENGKLIQQEQ